MKIPKLSASQRAEVLGDKAPKTFRAGGYDIPIGTPCCKTCGLPGYPGFPVQCQCQRNLNTASGDAVKTEPAPHPTASPDSGAGEVIGKTPWRVLNGCYLSHLVADAKDNILFSASPGIAHMAVTAVNAWTKLFGDVTNHRDVLRALQAQLVPLRAMPAIRRALELVERTLNPDSDPLQ